MNRLLLGLPLAIALAVRAGHAQPAPPVLRAPTTTPAQLIAHRLGGSSMAHIALLATPGGRDLLGHAIACALPYGASFTAIDRDGTPFTFTGSLGLAPAWPARATTSAERASLGLCLSAAGLGSLQT
ncbi:MAG TPA: hypothetical protein VGC42_12235 [Kofleriaceae bacterium]